MQLNENTIFDDDTYVAQNKYIVQLNQYFAQSYGNRIVKIQKFVLVICLTLSIAVCLSAHMSASRSESWTLPASPYLSFETPLVYKC